MICTNIYIFIINFWLMINILFMKINPLIYIYLSIIFFSINPIVTKYLLNNFTVFQLAAVRVSFISIMFFFYSINR